MSPALVDLAVTDEGESRDASPLPLTVCWAIWISTSAGLWWVALSVAATFF